LRNLMGEEMELVYSFTDPEENLSIPIEPPRPKGTVAR
jgi:hypothetical protein